MHSRVIARFARREIALGPLSASEFILVNGSLVKDFSLKTQRLVNISETRGAGQQLILTGVSGALEKTETI